MTAHNSHVLHHHTTRLLGSVPGWKHRVSLHLWVASSCTLLFLPHLCRVDMLISLLTPLFIHRVPDLGITTMNNVLEEARRIIRYSPVEIRYCRMCMCSQDKLTP